MRARAVDFVSRFLQLEAAAGILLATATVAALAWANSPAAGAYHTVLDARAGLSVHHWVNDALMAVFFYVVGLEVRRELTEGHLATRRAAAVPAIAAFGGMVVPAALFAAINAGGAGWGIPIATDIAFAVGVLALLGDRVPAALKVLLLGLAVADDVGAIAVIAVFYTEDLRPLWLAAAAAGLLTMVALRRSSPALWSPAAVLVWVCAYRSGVHATIAGVAAAAVTPTVWARRAEAALHPWSAYLILPVFALANAGVPLSRDDVAVAAGSPITAGVVVGLVAGKLIGVTAFTWLAVRLRAGELPAGVRWPHVAGMAAVAGIGFTVSIFVAGLAYPDAARQDAAKVGVLAASVIAATVGTVILARTGKAPASRQRPGRSSRSSASNPHHHSSRSPFA